ncbi:hypothetical protein FQR65_LT02976 [Abscondita terminalis]|nr:hypothetical protein FQR65_LT02976 [Abscondita terminalis]
MISVLETIVQSSFRYLRVHNYIMLVIILFILTPPILAAPASLCPESCSCTSSETYLNARCNSLNFFKKSLPHEQIKSLVTLDIRNASLTKVNANLNIFTNLKSLNLSNNKIRHVATSFLPKSLEVLDVSNNYIKYLPNDLHLLPKLKSVDFSGNPVNCDCDSVWVRDTLINRGVSIGKTVICDHPKGKSWDAINCDRDPIDLFDVMLGDAAYEGSGSEDELIQPTSKTEEETTIAQQVEEEEEGSGAGDILAPTPVSNEDNSNVTEDSEESGEVKEPVILPVGKAELGSGVIRACNFNCSTPSPINTNDNDTLPAPGLFESIHMIANDLGIIDETKETTSAATIAEEVTNDEVKRNETNASDAEIIDKGLNTDEELSKMSDSSSKQSYTSFVFLGLFFLAILCLVAYVIVKKRSRTRHVPPAPPNTEEKEETLEEVELLTKAITGNEKANGAPETVPLINGHKSSEDDVKEPEPKKQDEVQLRKMENFDDTNTITPEAKRVTIKAGEIPNSTPKTPVLVIRQKNSDGTIVTTPEVDQRV